MANQRTVAGEARVEGVGLHTGAEVRMEIRPAPADSGVVFVRVDLPGAPRVRACLENLRQLPRRTAIASGEAEVNTTEHLLATFHALGVHNAEVRLDGPEVPGMDGSALPFVRAVREAGIEDQGVPLAERVVETSVAVSERDACVVAFPADSDQSTALRVAYTLDYDSPLVESQYACFDLDADVFEREIAPARTFVLAEEVEMLRAAGLGRGASTQNTLVLGPEGVIENTLRFDDEFVRHKILDLIGDLFLVGAPLRGKLVATKSGHDLNTRLAERIVATPATPQGSRSTVRRLETTEDPFEGFDGNLGAPLDVRAIEKILPHRYPFLLVDRVVEIRDGSFARGLKAVTYNEEFFRGHFPGRPVMPGVLVLEAMAQLAGILLLSHEQNRGQAAYLLSLDGVKFRRPVVPGDQLVLESDVKSMRPRTAHCRVRALVEGALASEAEIRFMLIPADH